jgi:hypothetical protein
MMVVSLKSLKRRQLSVWGECCKTGQIDIILMLRVSCAVSIAEASTMAILSQFPEILVSWAKKKQWKARDQT